MSWIRFLEINKWCLRYHEQQLNDITERLNTTDRNSDLFKILINDYIYNLEMTWVIKETINKYIF